MNKNRIRLTESQLHKVIKECVKNALNENNFQPFKKPIRKSMGKKEWTEEKILDFVERHGGEGYSLIGRFPFSPSNKQKINAAYADDENYTDSDLCDYIIDLAIEQVNGNNLGESRLHKVIKESLNRVIKSKVKNKKRVIKESKSNWRGCPNVQMIWHGQWSDPELCADGYVANYWDVENSLWQSFLEETGHTDAESDNEEVEEEFSSWLQANESEVISTIAEYGNEF